MTWKGLRWRLTRQADASHAADALTRHAFLRTQTAREVASLKCKVAKLETAIEKATAAVSIASETARETANQLSQMQAQIRSVMSSLQQDKEVKVREADASVEVNRQWYASNRQSHASKQKRQRQFWYALLVVEPCVVLALSLIHI